MNSHVGVAKVARHPELIVAELYASSATVMWKMVYPTGFMAKQMPIGQKREAASGLAHLIANSKPADKQTVKWQKEIMKLSALLNLP